MCYILFKSSRRTKKKWRINDDSAYEKKMAAKILYFLGIDVIKENTSEDDFYRYCEWMLFAQVDSGLFTKEGKNNNFIK
jgi:hypothetical protein